MVEIKEIEDFDVVVVGGGFAGLTLGRVAAMRGLRAVVLDRRSCPGARVHTTGILVKEAAEALDVPARLTRKVHGVRLYGPGMWTMDLRSPGYYFLATDTAALLGWLAGEALNAGAELRYATPFHGATREGSGWRIDGTRLRARYLIGADGAHSRVARRLGLGCNRRFLVGVEAEYESGDRVEPDWLHCFVDRTLAPGYIGWAVPGLGITQVGLARDYPGRPDLQALLRKLVPVVDLRRERPVGWRAGTIPVSGPVRPFAAPGVMLVGDAAGWVSPLTGGGICNAFHYGRRAAQALGDYLQDGGPEPSAVLAREMSGYVMKGLARRVVSAFAPDVLVDRVLGTPAGRFLAQQIFFHARAGARLSPRAPHFLSREDPSVGREVSA